MVREQRKQWDKSADLGLVPRLVWGCELNGCPFAVLTEHDVACANEDHIEVSRAWKVPNSASKIVVHAYIDTEKWGLRKFE